LREAGLNLFKTMGYKSEKTFELSPNSAETFLAQFDPSRSWTEEGPDRILEVGGLSIPVDG